MAKRALIVVDLTSVKSLKESIRKWEKLRYRVARPNVIARKAAAEAERKYFKPMLRDLRRYPARSLAKGEKLEFVSDKQRRFVMAKLNGKPYKRTRSLATGWDARIRVQGNYIRGMVGNSVSYHRFVRGDYGMGRSRRSLERYEKVQMPFHRDRGKWGYAYEIIQPAVDKAHRHIHTRLIAWVFEGF